MNYLLDSNIFIQAKNVQYPFDIFPGFWQWLERDMQRGLIHSIEPVFNELMRGNDELKDWVSKYKDSGCFLRVDDEETQTAYRNIVNWVYSSDSKFMEYAKKEFLSVADPWLIAKAMVTNCSIVTLEKFDPNISKKIEIPNVCNVFHVNYINTIDLLRLFKVQFNLIS